MAEAAVSFLLSRLAGAALTEALNLYHVSDQVGPMQVKLRMIQSFLKDADVKRNENPRVKQWVKEVREVAHKIEDAMDTFLVTIEENPVKNRSKCAGCFSKIKRVIKTPKKLAQFRSEIGEIQNTLTAIHEETTLLGISDVGGGSEENNSVVPFRPTKLHQIDVSEVVGLDADKDQIVKHLLDRRILRRTVLSIVGIGGLGKTTLAKKVYKSAELEGRFDCRMWLSISQKFDPTNLFRHILYSIVPHMEEKQPPMKDDDIAMEIEKFLKEKRYLVVLDDVWTTDLWDRFKLTLPDMNNGSRVLITSRSLDVARAADPKTPPHNLRYLNEEESLDLLLRKALPYEQLENYPPDIKKVAIELTKNCGGLPLALIVLGGILSRKEHTYDAWHEVEQTIDWHNEEGQKCSQVLVMSYKDLPYHLKPCFLYLASFPEDYEISAKHVTRMWIAEGFIPKDRAETLEDKAHDYLEELVQRCLVHVVQKSWTGYCNYFRVHDLLRDLAIHEAKEENFFTVFLKPEDGSQLDAKLARRAALQSCPPTEYGVLSTNTRALLFFGQCIPNFGGFRLLRVLTIERVDMREKRVDYENWLKGLIHLKYLGFRHCEQLLGFERVSFSYLKNLESFEIRYTKIPNGPDDSLWKVPTLRHVNSHFITPLICNPSKWDHLSKNLQTLKWVKLQKFPDLKCNFNLRKMGFNLSNDFWGQSGSLEEVRDKLKGVLKRVDHLVSLGIDSDDYVPFPIDGLSELPCYEKIQRMYLRGVWSRGIVLDVEMFPTNLTKLSLRDSELKQDPMPILERLQSLRVLGLRVNSYAGTELICSPGGFPSLQTLEITELPKFCHLNIKEGAMPMLHRLILRRCYKLQVLPELQNVSTLQELVLQQLSGELNERIKSEDLYKIKHIPFVRALN